MIWNGSKMRLQSGLNPVSSDSRYSDEPSYCIEAEIAICRGTEISVVKDKISDLDIKWLQ